MPAGNYKPTPTHYFIKLLHDKGLLLRAFTQNIDSLEHEVRRLHFSVSFGGLGFYCLATHNLVGQSLTGKAPAALRKHARLAPACWLCACRGLGITSCLPTHAKLYTAS
jgi:hypothetical protein